MLAKAAQGYPGAAQLRLGGNDSKDVAGLGVGLHVQQQVGRGEIEEAQGMGLDGLRQIQHAPQLGGGMRDAHRHDGDVYKRQGTPRKTEIPVYTNLVAALTL